MRNLVFSQNIEDLKRAIGLLVRRKANIDEKLTMINNKYFRIWMSENVTYENFLDKIK